MSRSKCIYINIYIIYITTADDTYDEEIVKNHFLKEKKVILTKLFSIVHVEKRLGNKNTASSMTAARMTAGIRADRNARINERGHA